MTIIINILSVILFRIAHHATQNNSADGQLQAPLKILTAVIEQQMAWQPAKRVSERYGRETFRFAGNSRNKIPCF